MKFVGSLFRERVRSFLKTGPVKIIIFMYVCPHKLLHL